MAIKTRRLLFSFIAAVTIGNVSAPADADEIALSLITSTDALTFR
jgi:hypothetical protein